MYKRQILTIFLITQIVTGIVLAMHYVPHVDHAFESVEHIMRDVNYGWLIRYAHANGASMFFLAVYIHIFRGLFYGSYKSPREMIWITGLIIYLLMMATAFMGYVLPWGQMSFWAATVITNLFSAIPLFGENVTEWLWGGFSVDNPTLIRFYSLHYLFPFLIFGLVVLHIWALLLYIHRILQRREFHFRRSHKWPLKLLCGTAKAAWAVASDLLWLQQMLCKYHRNLLYERVPQHQALVYAQDP